MHAAILGKACHQAGAVERGDAGGIAGEVEARGIGKADEHLGVATDHLEVEIGDQPDGVVAADAGDDPRNIRIGEGRHQVLGPGLRVGPHPVGRRQRVRHLNQLDAEALFELALAGRIARGNGSGTTPGRTDRRDPVSGPEPAGLDQRSLVVTSHLGSCRFLRVLIPSRGAVGHHFDRPDGISVERDTTLRPVPCLLSLEL